MRFNGTRAFTNLQQRLDMIRRQAAKCKRTVTRVDQPAATPSTLDITPFPNVSTLLLYNWFQNDGETKSIKSLGRLTQEVLKNPHFDAAEVHDTDWQRLAQKLDQADGTLAGRGRSTTDALGSDRPQQDTVTINVYHGGEVHFELSHESVPDRERLARKPDSAILSPALPRRLSRRHRQQQLSGGIRMDTLRRAIRGRRPGRARPFGVLHRQPLHPRRLAAAASRAALRMRPTTRHFAAR
jgi:hypothetical protein